MSQFEALVRSRYFSGQLLSVDDFAREQAYTLGRLRRRNRFLSGWGVVAGLGVSVEPGDTVVVQPGMAIDCAGNEVIVEAAARLVLAGLSGRQHVLLSYLEIDEAAVALATGLQEFSRVRESSRLEVSPLNPAAGHRAMGCGTPGCGRAHGVGIAVLSQKNLRWRVASSLRPIKSARR